MNWAYDEIQKIHRDVATTEDDFVGFNLHFPRLHGGLD